MYRKISIIILLAILLASFLVGRHFYLARSFEPEIVDRIPDGDVLIRTNLLELAHETTGMFHFNKVEYRDFLSKEFLLGQAKSYGLDLQASVYGFANEDGSWGFLIHVTDSSEIGAGIGRVKQLIDVTEGDLGGQRIYSWTKEKSYLTYGKNWLFVYRGDKFPKILRRVLDAKKGDQSESWIAFLEEKHFAEKNLVLYSTAQSLKEYGIEKAMFAHNVDSASVTLLSYIKSNEPFNISPKEEGLALPVSPTSNQYLNLHVDAKSFGSNKEDPIHRYMQKMSRKISFPMDDFLVAWKGDLSFREGGEQIVKETFIESVMDDNFEVTEVVSTRETKVKGFSLALSMNDKANYLINKLLSNGILTKEKEKYRFLISPPLSMKKVNDYYIFYFGDRQPHLIPNQENSGYLSYKRTPFTFKVDTIKKNEIYGKIDFPVQRLLRPSKFF